MAGCAVWGREGVFRGILLKTLNLEIQQICLRRGSMIWWGLGHRLSGLGLLLLVDIPIKSPSQALRGLVRPHSYTLYNPSATSYQTVTKPYSTPSIKPVESPCCPTNPQALNLKP